MVNKSKRKRRRAAKERPRRFRNRAGEAPIAMLKLSTSLSELQAGGAPGAPVVAGLPAGVALSERAVAALRSYLIASGLSEYRIFYCHEHDLHDVEDCLEATDEPSPAAWEA